MKAKKVAIIYSGAKYSGGIETYIENLFENLDNKKVDLTLVSLGKWPLSEKLNKRKYAVVYFSGQRINVGTIFGIRKYLMQNNFQLIESQGTVANAYARAISFISKISSLVTVHSIQADEYDNPLVRGIYLMIERLTRFPTKKYVAVSEYVGKKLVGSGISKERITVIPNGVANNSKPETRNSKLDRTQLVIGSIGRLSYIKGYHNLVEAMALISNDKVTLKVAGEGEERLNLERLARLRGLTDRVAFVGQTEGPYKFLEDVDIYVQPSLSEGFGLTVVEAMYASRPVVVTPVGSLPELVTDGVNGVISGGTSPSALAAALQLLLEDETLREKLGRAASVYAKDSYSIKRWAGKVVEVYLDA